MPGIDTNGEIFQRFFLVCVFLVYFLQAYVSIFFFGGGQADVLWSLVKVIEEGSVSVYIIFAGHPWCRLHETGFFEEHFVGWMV